MIRISYEQLRQDAKELANKIPHRYSSVHPIVRGGVFPATIIANVLNLPLVADGEMDVHTLVVDDLIDSGKTLEAYEHKWDTAVLYRKPHSPQTTYCNRQDTILQTQHHGKEH